jgi:hypothetical protein
MSVTAIMPTRPRKKSREIIFEDDESDSLNINGNSERSDSGSSSSESIQDSPTG